MYDTKKLLKLVTKMESAKSEDAIQKLAAEELFIIERISDKLHFIAMELKKEGVISHDQQVKIQDFRHNIGFIHFALDDIVNVHTEKEVAEKIKYLRKMIERYELKLEDLEKELGEDIKHVSGAVDKLKEAMKDLKQLDESVVVECKKVNEKYMCDFKGIEHREHHTD